ncbi:MAG: FGGY family carbohydrate kinase [Caldilineaceae bacterium]
MTLLALDLGTTFIKGAVLDPATYQMRHVQRQPFPGPIPHLPPLFYEVAPEPLVQTVRTLLRDLLTHAPDCTGVLFCTQMHGLVLCTAQGEARSNVITWQDQRVLTPHPNGQGSYFDQLRAALSEAERRQLGNEVQPSRPLSYLYWMAATGRLPQEPVIPAALADFVIANLAGTAPVIEPTNAGAHGALNLETMTWHKTILERLGLSSLQWPMIQPFGAPVATITLDGQPLPCYGAVGDHQCAVLGALLGADELSLNISTGSQVSLLTPALQSGDYQTRPYFDGRFLNTITGIPAGRALNHLVHLIAEVSQAQGAAPADPWDYIVQAAEAVDSSDLTVNLAFFDSVGGRSGQIGNIREDNLSVGHLFRAAFQTMANNYYTSAQRLAPAQPLQRLVFSGGLGQKIALLRRLIQQQFGLDYRLCPTAEDTMLGLLTLGLVATGQAASVTAATAQLLPVAHQLSWE